MKGADNHKVSLHATGPSSRDSRRETFLQSLLEDVDISEKGADDHICLCVSTGSLASSCRIRTNVCCLRALLDLNALG